MHTGLGRLKKMSLNEMETNLFKAATVNELVKKGFLPNGQVTQAQIDLVRNEAIHDFEIDRQTFVSECTSVVDLLVNFQEWLGTWEGPSPVVQLHTVSVSIAFPYGRSTVTFNASGTVCDENDSAAMEKAHMELFSRVTGSIETFLRDRKIPETSGENSHNGNSNGLEEVQIIGANKVVSRRGTTYAVLISNQYSKGTFVKTEVLKNGGVSQDEFNRWNVGFNPLSGVAKIGTGSDGKGKEVKEFRRS